MEDLPFRRDLTLNKKILLGNELEASGFSIQNCQQTKAFSDLSVPFLIDTAFERHKGGEYDKWIFSHDSTVTKKDLTGVEVISPISILNTPFLIELEKICLFLKNHGAFIDQFCSNHIHFDFRVFHKNINALKKFILIMSYYEPEWNRFFAGEFQELRIGTNYYARNITKRLYQLDKLHDLFAIDSLILFLNELKKLGRYHTVNCTSASETKKISRNTIEERSPNGSLNPVILENNIYFLLKTVEYCLENDEWQNLYQEWLLLQGEENRSPSLSKSRKLSRTIFQDKEDLRYFDWQYEKHF
ncbi:MAG: hypothetical protein HFI09_01240 [Bacilli bacterium]|nr:hypothetical protein [Bacilli bacterium]